MNIRTELFDGELRLSNDLVNLFVIEDSDFFYRFICDLNGYINKKDNSIIVFDNNSILKFEKKIDLLTSCFSLDINNKKIISKLYAELDNISNDEYYASTNELLSMVTNHLYNLSNSFDYNIDYSNVTLLNILKACNVEIIDDSESLIDKIINYITISLDLLDTELFIFVNFKSFINDNKFQDFIDTIVSKHINVLMLENNDINGYDHVNKTILDKDLCII